MSDVAVIEIQEEGRSLFYYGHWTGSSVFGRVKEALIRGKARWDDPPYLARIIFCTFCPKSEYDDLTGFGISAHGFESTDNHIIVDMDAKEVIHNQIRWSFQKYTEQEFK